MCVIYAWDIWRRLSSIRNADKCKHNSNARHIERCQQVGEIPLMRIVRFECGSMFDIDMCQGLLRALPATSSCHSDYLQSLNTIDSKNNQNNFQPLPSTKWLAFSAMRAQHAKWSLPFHRPRPIPLPIPLPDPVPASSIWCFRRGVLLAGQTYAHHVYFSLCP